MSRCMGTVCAGALLFAIGCLGPAYKQVVPGPYSPVAAMLETGLTEAGIRVVSKSHSNEIRLAGQTKSGKVFCLYVRPAPTKAEKTAVTIHCDEGVDEDFWRLVVSILNGPVSKEKDEG